jgi:hypothetical protein
MTTVDGCPENGQQGGRQAGDSNDEITPEMIEAGVSAFYEWKEFVGSKELVAAVYSAMRRAAKSSTADSDQGGAAAVSL